LGYNSTAKKKEDEALIYYDKAMKESKKPNEVYGIASFEKKY
jgi:hypothetical protein